MDLYKRESRILFLEKSFAMLCPNCFNILREFEHDLRLNNYSAGRIEKYRSFLKSIHKKLGK